MGTAPLFGGMMVLRGVGCGVRGDNGYTMLDPLGNQSPLDCTLKMATMISFVFYELYNKKKTTNHT